MAATRRLLRREWPLALALPLLGLLLFPYFWLVSGAFKSAREVFAVPPQLIPAQPTLANFIAVLGRSDIQRYFLNSAFITATVLALNLLLGSAAAYALATYRFRG